jgi:hypothetical protein
LFVPSRNYLKLLRYIKRWYIKRGWYNTVVLEMMVLVLAGR